MTGPLHGMRVIEMAGIGPVPLAGQFLADLGADVIVVARKSGTQSTADINNRGKRSVSVDLKTPQGVEVIRRVLMDADVLIEGFRPGVMERIGLGPEECREYAPKLIYGRMTGWGQTGPLASSAGHDINYLALTGVLNAMGSRDRPPMPPLNVAADYAGGTMFLLLGVLSALFERQSSGKGQVVDAAMVDGAPALMALVHSLLAMGKWTDTREDNWLDGAAPFYRSYECADGKFISVGALEPQFYALLLELAGLPKAHLENQMDQTKWPQRRIEYAAVFKQKTRDEWAAIFDGTDACVAPVLSWSEAPDHPHMKARGVFDTIEGVTQARPAPRFSRSVTGPVKAPPAPGADTRELLNSIGYSDDEIMRLKESGVLT